MYASLISAGVSQLSDLYASVTGKSSTSSTSPTSFDPSSSTSSVSPTSAVNSTSSSGSKFSDALQKLFTDLQASASGSTNASTSGSTDPTSTIAGDLKSLFGAKGAHGHGHHHGATPAQLPGDDTQTVDGTTSTSGSGSSGTSGSNSFQSLASSLLAYAKSQSLTSSATATSLTA